MLPQYPGPFQVMTGTGPKIVLPNRFADEVRNNPSLNVPKALSPDFFSKYPGFGNQPFPQQYEVEAIRVKLTQSLGLVTDGLVDETTASLQQIYGDSHKWTSVALRDSVMDLVARLSSRVFLGTTLCRNKRWLEISKDYTTHAFMASIMLRKTNPLLRPILYWRIPQCTALRKALNDARELIGPEVERRKLAVDQAVKVGDKLSKSSDMLGWMYEILRAKGEEKDLVISQLALSMAAIHTTTDSLSQAILHICEYSEIVADLRREIVEVIGTQGWTRSALHQLKLMDSFLKESQRHSPMLMSMHYSHTRNLPFNADL
ncbi:unnamed protein product [Discula destructiva]